jgi:hypothetical protein
MSIYYDVDSGMGAEVHVDYYRNRHRSADRDASGDGMTPHLVNSLI